MASKAVDTARGALEAFGEGAKFPGEVVEMVGMGYVIIVVLLGHLQGGARLLRGLTQR